MRECWNGDKELRPTFQELKEEFDGLISLAEGYKYVEPLGSVAAEAGLVGDSAEAPVHDQPTSSSARLSVIQAHLEAASEDSTG